MLSIYEGKKPSVCSIPHPLIILTLSPLLIQRCAQEQRLSLVSPTSLTKLSIPASDKRRGPLYILCILWKHKSGSGASMHECTHSKQVAKGAVPLVLAGDLRRGEMGLLFAQTR